jgi:hypothetical protein
VEHEIAHVEEGGLSQRPEVSGVQEKQEKGENIYPGLVHHGEKRSLIAQNQCLKLARGAN